VYFFMRELAIRTNEKSKAAMVSVSQELALLGIACRSISTPLNLNLVVVCLQTARVSDDSGGAS